MNENGGRKTILIIEDDDAEREALAAALRQADYSVAAVTNGQEGIEYLRDGKPAALILLAMLMPVMDGWRFLEQLKQWRPSLEKPIVVMADTALSAQWGKLHDCAGLLHKPVAAAELLAEVKRLVV